jgi:hypothetical protein
MGWDHEIISGCNRGSKREIVNNAQGMYEGIRASIDDTLVLLWRLDVEKMARKR